MKLKGNNLIIEPIIPTSTIHLVKDPIIDRATVKAVGEECELKVGDTVIIAKTSLSRFENNELYISEDNIYAVL